MGKYMRQFSSVLFAILMTICVLNSASANELIVYTWEDYLSEAVIEGFEKETGLQVKQVYFDSDQTRDQVFASTKGSQFDIVLFDSVAGMIFGKNDHLQAISQSTVPNIKNVDKQWQESCGNFGLPYYYGTVGLLYDTTQYDSPPDSWADLLTPPEEHQGHIGMIKDMTDILIPPLISLGYNINSEKESELKEAFRLLQQQLPSVSLYEYSLTAIRSNSTKKIHIAIGFSGDQYTLNEETGTENWVYVIPKEGTALWVDCFTVPRGAKNKKNALAFLNYISTIEIAAENTEEIYTSSTISGIRKFLPEEVANDSDLFPSKDFLENAQMYRILSDSTLLLRRRILDALIKQHEAQ